MARHRSQEFISYVRYCEKLADSVADDHPSNAKAKLAFFNLENLQVELIEPIGDEPSSWKEFLDTKGEGVHHIAFRTVGMGEQYLEEYAKAGQPVAQHGGWDGGEYGYMDTDKSLGVIVELLEMYNR